jgi:hypothetical protein
MYKKYEFCGIGSMEGGRMRGRGSGRERRRERREKEMKVPLRVRPALLMAHCTHENCVHSSTQGTQSLAGTQHHATHHPHNTPPSQKDRVKRGLEIINKNH